MSRKIKVLHLIKSLGRGGAETLLPETLQLHDKSKFEFYYGYFLPWKNQMVESIRASGSTVVCFAARNNIQLVLHTRVVAKYAQQNKIDVIHAHLPWAGIVARLVGKLTGIPVLYTEHNKQERYHFLTRMANLLTLNMTRAVIAVSADVAASIHKHKPQIASPVITILNGVNTDKFSRALFDGATLKQKLGIPKESLVIGTIAVFRLQKRLDVWLRIAAAILVKLPDAHFIIVGDGPLKRDLFKMRNELGLSQRVHFPGLETEVRPYLAAFDVYMMTSLFEGLPIALLESMSMGCPVVSTGAGGVAEVVRDGKDGFVCPVDDPDQLVQMAVSLFENSEQRAQYSIAARKRVVERFSLSQMVSELESLYSRTLSSGDERSTR